MHLGDKLPWRRSSTAGVCAEARRIEEPQLERALPLLHEIRRDFAHHRPLAVSVEELRPGGRRVSGCRHDVAREVPENEHVANGRWVAYEQSGGAANQSCAGISDWLTRETVTLAVTAWWPEVGPPARCR